MSDKVEGESSATEEFESLRHDAMALAAAINPITRKAAPDHLTMAAAARVLELQAGEIDRLRSALLTLRGRLLLAKPDADTRLFDELLLGT